MGTSEPGREDLIRAITSSWGRDSSTEPERWTRENPALGQCAVTALVVQDYLGGRLLRGLVGDVSHYWNELPTGEELDLTRQQFEHFVADNLQRRGRDYVLSFIDTRRRYHTLSKRVSEQMEVWSRFSLV